VGIVYLVNIGLGAIPWKPGGQPLSLQLVFGWAFAPFAALMGVPLGDVPEVGQLLGTKTVLNEFLAYVQMKGMLDAEGGPAIGERARVIATYALCGFANPGSMAIIIGGLSGIDPDRRGEFARLGWKCLVAGTLAAFCTACVAGMMT
jgi:CNT family concentrative nucleoside transporter